MQGWLKFVETAVARYCDEVKHWDIWNEPNIDFWQPEPNPQDYAHLLKATSEKIKSIDPSAQVIGLGTSTIDFHYVSDVLQEDVIESIDYLGFHPYRYYPEDDQDNMGLPYPPSPSTRYEEELQALKDTLAKYDPTGRVGFWDEEAGYPSQPEIFIWTSDTIYSSDATQAKYLLRRFFLNLGFGVRVTTWFYDYDQVSAYPSILGSTWYQHYYDADWFEKEVPFHFNYLGITYSPPAETLLIEAEHYDTLYPPLEDGGTYIYTNDGDGDLQGSAIYNIEIPDSGLYTVWLRMRNPDETASFVVSIDDTNPHWVSNSQNTGTGSQFIWSVPVNAELIRWHYLFRGVHLFTLNAGSHWLRIRTGTDGSSLDKIIVKEEEPALTLKPAYYALQNLAAVFDCKIISDTGLGFSFENIDVPMADWSELRGFGFQDTSSENWLISYWLGTKVVDDHHRDHHINLTVEVNPAVNPRIINFLDGSVDEITSFTVIDSTVIFDSLPIADFPYCLALHWPTGVEEGGTRSVQKVPLTVSPNPCRQLSAIKYQLPTQSSVSLRIYELSGRLVMTLVDEEQEMGEYCLAWDGTDDKGRDVPSGTYFIKLQVGGKCSQSKKLLLLR